MCVKKGEINGKHERHGDRDEYKSSTAAHISDPRIEEKYYCVVRTI
jgi:hypothetical protein